METNNGVSEPRFYVLLPTVGWGKEEWSIGQSKELIKIINFARRNET